MQSASRGSFKRVKNISCHSVKFKTGVSVYMVMKPLTQLFVVITQDSDAMRGGE